VRGAFNLLDGIDRWHAYDGGAVLNDRVDGAIDGGWVNQRANRIMYQDDVVGRSGDGIEGVRYRLLAMVTARYHSHPAVEAVFRYLGLHAFHLRLAHRDDDRRYPLNRGEGAQGVNQDGNAIEHEKLFRLRPGHPCAQARSGKYHKYLHNSWSIQRLHALPPCQRLAWARRHGVQGGYHPLVRAHEPTLPIDTTLMRPGLRLAVGVSGGADSVALLRTLNGQSRELGLVLHVAHLHHGLRGAEADADQAFVRSLAEQLEIPFHEGNVDTGGEAAADPGAGKSAESIEEAARRLRYAWFRQLMASGAVDAVATAHTRDDQAETVIAKFLRGAWTEGLSGIHPTIQFPEGPILRPMLSTSRAEVEAYLRALGQTWREDSSNRQLTFTRNRIRHELLPLLETWNPKLRDHLAQMAELARDEEAWWQAELVRIVPKVSLPGRPVRGGGRATSDGIALEVAQLGALPLAMQRRLLRYVAEQLGSAPDFAATEALRTLALTGRAGQKCELAEGLRAERTHREIRLSMQAAAPANQGIPAESSDFTVSIPGEVDAPVFGLKLRIEQSARTGVAEGHPEACATLRNWRPGDRVTLRHSSGPRKVKEVLERLRVSGAARALWPVLEMGGRIVWMQGVELEPELGMEFHASPLGP
jgi:tRNA(Ile)-lysidine synthase